jgi:hypothetical protein
VSTLFAAFCGASTAERSVSADAARTINMYRTTVESDGSPKRAYLIGTPGLDAFGTVATEGNRGVFTQDGRTWSVVGGTLYEAVTLDPFNAVDRGAILDDGQPVSFASNGDGGAQLAIVGGGQLKVLNLVTNVLSAAIALPMTRNPGLIGFLDGYFIINERNSLICWFSAIEDGTLWDALDFFTRSTASDHIIGQVCANNRCWIFGSETSEAYEDVGDADNPFQPIKGSLFQIGCFSEWTINVGVNTVRWGGRSSRGGAVIYRLDGYNGTRVSTHAIEAQLGNAPTLADAEAMTYEQDGHLFYCLTCPSAGADGETYVWDETETEWHDRTSRTALGREGQWRVRGHAYVGSTHVVGSWDSGKIWALDLNTYDEDGEILRAVRRAPYLSAESAYAFIDAFELGVEPGSGLVSGEGSAPDAELRISKDRGKTWFSAGTAPLGPLGQYDDRTFWTRLGRARVDRLVFEVVISAPVKRVIGPGAWLRVTPGRA